MTMDKQILRDFVRDILAFREEIPIPSGDLDSFMEAAVQYDSRILFYMGAISARRRLGTLTLHLQYRNRDVPLGRVFRVWEPGQLQLVLRREIQNWTEHFGIVIHDGMDPQMEVKRFLKLNSLSRLHQLSWNRGTCRWGWVSTRFDPVFMGERAVVMDMDRRAEAAAVHLSRQLFLPGMPPEAKCLAAHNYLASTTSYLLPGDDLLEQYRRASAYGALVEKKAVCQGYAEAFQLLMRLAGIDCLTVSGSTRRRGDENHAWNLVKLPGEDYCHVDVTWDSREGRSAMTYYLRSDSFLSDRDWARNQIPPAPRDSRSLPRAERWFRDNREMLLRRGYPGKALPAA